jgi:hypothetical protein
LGHQYTGSGGGGSTPPTAPTWGTPAVTPVSGQVTLKVVAASPTDVIYARYKLKTATGWVAQSESFRRTGSGNIVVTGLTNEALYVFSGYAKAGGLESEWLSPRESTPTAGVLGAYTTLHAELVAALQASAVLASACTDGLPALHVKDGRYLHTDADGLVALLAYGPVVYVPYKPYNFGRFTREHAVGDLGAEVMVVQYFNQSASNSEVTLNSFVEKLKTELVSGCDGTASRWSNRAFNLRVRIGEPSVLTKDAMAWPISLTAGYSEAI